MREAELINAVKDGDREALITLLRQLEPHVYRTAFYMLNHEQDALDATQDALLKIYQNIHTFEYKAKLTTWAQRIVTNVCIDAIRKKREKVSVDEHEYLLEQLSHEHVDDTIEHQLLKEELQEGIALLPDHLSSVIVLRYIQDYKYNEIAEILDIPINTVKSHLFRARRQLYKIINNQKKGGVSS